MDDQATPGPWTVDYAMGIIGPDGAPIAYVMADSSSKPTANARLIAASRCLLDELKRIREIGGFSGLDHLDSVAALIARAEGRAE